MGILVQYVGARAYTEFPLNGVRTGFSRGMIRELPEDFVDAMIRPGIENGSKMWKIVDEVKPDQTEAMKSVIEPTVEEPVEETSNEDVDYSSLTRAKLMSLCKERGIAVKNTSKKAELIELLSA
tara:strand:- start:101 stop:472 length:372 start_codon:yes stop_codon:yes gene_type:complete